jgi:hypothetical protein
MFHPRSPDPSNLALLGAACRLVCLANLPLALLQHPAFRDYSSALNHRIHIPSVNTARDHTLRLGCACREAICAELAEVEALSVAFDGSTSAARTGLITATGHLDEKQLGGLILPRASRQEESRAKQRSLRRWWQAGFWRRCASASVYFALTGPGDMLMR